VCNIFTYRQSFPVCFQHHIVISVTASSPERSCVCVYVYIYIYVCVCVCVCIYECFDA
jgi:hypothetical protein